MISFKRWKKTVLFLLAPAAAAALSYDVNIVGLKDPEALKALFDVSDLVLLQERPPASINGLRYRAASDVPAMLKALRAYGYYDASVATEISSGAEENVQVFVVIRPGPQYKIASYEVFHGEACAVPAELPNCCPFTPEQVGLEVGQPALAVDIVNAELQLLTELSRCGYPLAAVEKRKVEVDMAKKQVKAASCIDEGPLSKFGPISIFGIENVEPRFIERRISWKEGDVYTPDAVEETQKRLLNSDLFTSVMITHGDELDDLGELPMKMRVTEASSKQLSLGVYYATVDGPGVDLGWVHRNFGGMGDTLSLDADFSKRYLAGKLAYKRPDFFRLDQTYRVFAEISRENIHPYLAFIYRGANYIERKLDTRRSFSAGLKIEHINVSESASNGTYLLMGLPLFGKYNTAENLLDPISGYSVTYSITPYQSFFHASQRFAKQRFTGTLYIPIIRPKVLVLALVAQLGSIAGTAQRNIPLTKLFLGGSEENLRGYRYKTVSPLDAQGRPLGGRSAIFASIEPRFRITETIGIVPFMDFGSVTFNEIPRFDAKWFKSVGVGLRYFSFFGPLRVDVGFPLNRRKGIDSKYQLYAAVGQAF